ncbi:MAG: formylglycine-generating enzyme family protein [Chloroflexi bacterium]|nr:formylglycine-generating enzyme family protein [Anaerolineae bacterium]RLC74333.1 MAG: formylglycine-generating enzyme family protein [Chloroflexota bacterium]
MRLKLWVLLAVSLLLLTACEVEVPGGGFLTATPASTGPTPTPVIIGRPEVKPTDTPMPMPPTPTPRPTFTPASTPVVGETPEATSQPAEETTQPAADMVLIPAGPFIMGSDSDDPDEAPQHEVDLPAFEIDLFEVTNAQFAAFVEATGYQTDAEKGGEAGWRGFYTEGKDNHPVVKVSWNDAVAYCKWVGKRLPTEAEWEKAARGTDGRIYPWGNEWDPARLNSYQSGYRGTTPVGSFADGVSPYGVFDMAGNVWEWTADWYLPYPGSNYQDPYFGKENKVTRGGGWFEEPPQVRTSNRNCTSPIAANDDLGFRCAR